ncbi:MAG: type IV pilus inner membrane component PilO [Planctomycetota bacterium]|jgi:Tfp pilus assembly protein PilO
MPTEIKKDTLVVLGILGAMIIGAVVGLFMPQSRKLKGIKTQTTSQKLQLTADAQKAAVVPQLLEHVEGMKRRYKDFDRRLPQRKELGGFLREISEHLGAVNLVDPTIEPGSPTQSDLFLTLPIRMRFQGDYLDVARFLKDLHGMERLARVQKLQLRESPTGHLLDVELQVNIYFTES